MTKCLYLNNDVLKWARESAGYTLDDVSSTYKNISKWENGEDFPTYNQLESLSNKYKRPIAIFFFPNPPEEQPAKKSFRTIPDYELDDLNPELLKIFRKAQLMQLYLAEVNNNVNPAQKNIIKDLAIEKSNLRFNIQQIRSFLDFTIEDQIKCKNNDEAFECWRTVLTECGINVFKDAFKNDSVSGFCLYDENFPIIYVNNSVSKSRQIFTLFHELAHLLIKNNHIDLEKLDYIDSLNSIDKQTETVCNKFAGEFLVPARDLQKRVVNQDITDKLIINLSNIYSVSQEVILRKLFDNRLIDRKTYLQKVNILNKEFKDFHKKESGGNYYFTHITYLGRPYLSLVFEKYNLNLISFDNAVKYTGVTAKNFNKLEYHFNNTKRAY